MTTETLVEDLKGLNIDHEGVIPHLYRDINGNITIGKGHLLADIEKAKELPFNVQGSVSKQAPQSQVEAEFRKIQSLPFGKEYPASYYQAHTSLCLTHAAIEKIEHADIVKKLQEIRHTFPDFESFPHQAKLGVLDMSFNLGVTGLQEKFPKFTHAVRTQDWLVAGQECGRRVQPERNQKTRELFETAHKYTLQRDSTPINVSSSDANSSIVIVMTDMGSTIRVDNVRAPSNVSFATTHDPIPFQLEVNGKRLSNEQASAYLCEIVTRQPQINTTMQQRHVLQRTMLANLPKNPSYFLSSNTALTHSANQVNVDSQWDALVGFCEGMDHYAFETFGEMAKHVADYRLSGQPLIQLRRTLGNRAFRREMLTRSVHRELAHFIFNEEVGIAAYVLAELGEQIEHFHHEHPNHSMQTMDALRIGGEVGAKVYSLMKICNSSWFSNVFAATETGVHHILSNAAGRLGIASVHPLVATAVTVFTVNYLVHKYWDDVWNIAKQAPEYFADVWQKSSSLMASPPLQLNGSRMPQQMNGGALLGSEISPAAPYLETFMDICVAAPVLKPIERMIANLQRNIPSLFLANQKLLYPSLAGMFGQKQFEIFIQELFDKTQSKETDLQKFQQSIKDHFEQQASKHRYYFGASPTFNQSDDQTSHRPGEGGSFVASIEGGRLNYAFKVDPVKSPRAAGALIALHLLVSYIKWMRLSPGEKAVATFEDQLENLTAAKNRDWLSLPVLYRSVTNQGMEGAEQFYHSSVRDQIKTVIDTHDDDPKVVRAYKAMHFALENNDDALLTKPRFRDYQGMDKRCEDDFNDRINQFNRQMENSDLSGAADTAASLEKKHSYDVATHIARVQVSLKNGDMVAAKNAVNNAEDCDKRERQLARCVDYQLVDNGHGMKIDVQAAAINHAEELHEQVNHTKYSYLMKEYDKAEQKQKSHRLDAALFHTKACLAEDGNNVRYLGNHVDLLLSAGIPEQTVGYLEKICSLSPQPRNYYRLADILSDLGELAKANDFYQKGLSVSHYNYNNEKLLTYAMQCRVRENYITLEQYNEAKDIAKKIYNSTSAQPDDITSYAILCFQVGNDLMANCQILSANLAYEEGLAIPSYSNPSMRHDVQCKVRDNYIALENYDAALKFAKEVYNSLESRPTDIYSYAILCLQNKQLENAEIALQQFTEHPDVVENSEYQELLSDSHAKLGDILATKGDFSGSQVEYQKSLISNASNIGALLGFSRILCSKGDYFTAEKHLFKARNRAAELELFYESEKLKLREEEARLKSENKSTYLLQRKLKELDAGSISVKESIEEAKSYLNTIQKYRSDCLTQFRNAVLFELASAAFNYYLMTGNLSKEWRSRLVLAKQIFHLGHDLVPNLIRHRHLLPRWGKMTSAGKFSYSLGKLCLLANLIDQADAHFGWELPDHMVGINWRNAVKCGQVSVELGIAYDALVNTVWQDDQLYHYLGDMSPYAYGAALALAYGIDVGEALVRGSYRLYYGEYMPKSENRAYLFTKDFASGVGFTSMLCLSQPDALYLMFEGAKMGGGYVLSYFPDIPVTPEQLAIGAAVVAGAVVVSGIGYYAYNRSWYNKLNNILANAYELSERKNYEDAIKKYKESFVMKPDESTLKTVNRNIFAVSNVRLEADIHKICDGKEKLSLQDIRNILTAYDVHLKEVGIDETRLNQKQIWQATESLMIDLHTAYELQQKNDHTGAIKIYKDCLKNKLDDETTSNIQNNIIAISEQRLLDIMKTYADNKNLTNDDLQQMIDAYNIHLQDVPADEKRQSELIDLQLLLQRQTEFQHGELLNALNSWQKYVDRHPNDKIQKEELSKARCIIYTQEGIEEAMQYCLERLRDNAKDVTALRCRVQLLLATGELTNARHDIELLITLEPQDPISYQQLAYIEQAEGNLIHASQCAQKAVELHTQNKSPIDKLNKAKEQLDSIKTNITGRTISNLSQCLSSVLQAFSDYFTTPSPSIEKPFIAKPSLPQWTRFSMLQAQNESVSEINSENLVETVRTNLCEETFLTVIGESTETSILASDEPTLFSVGENQFISNDSVEMSDTDTTNLGEVQLYPEDISIAEQARNDVDKKMMMALSFFVKNQQFWLKPPQPSKSVINLHGVVVGNERTMVSLTRAL